MDGDGDTYFFEVISQLPDWLQQNSNNFQLIGTPGEEDIGTYNIEIKVTDQTGDTAQEFILSVENINDPPVIEAGSIENIIEGENFNFNFLVTDPDIGDEVVINISGLPDG